MEDANKIFLCPQCGQRIRVPSNKHIRFTCPNCTRKFELINGASVIGCRGEPPDGQKRRKGKVSPELIALSLIILGPIIYWLIIPTPFHINPQPLPDQTVYSENIFGKENDTLVPSRAGLKRDSIFDENLKDFMKDLSLELLDHLTEAISEEADRGNWEKANEWFEKTKQAMAQSGRKGQDIMRRYEADFAELKIKMVKQNPDKNDLPQSAATNKNESEKETATVEI